MKTAARLGERISTTELARPPMAPTLGRIPLEASPAQADWWRAQHAERVKEYHAALARYREEQDGLPQLRAELQAADRELAQLEASIASIEAQTAAGEPAFHRAIEEARDQDLIFELGRMLGKASDAFRSEGKPFKGFWTLLAASCVLDFIESAVANPAFATEARQRFTTNAEALTPLVQRGLAAIARGCLAGPTVVAGALAANRATVAATGRAPSETALIAPCRKHSARTQHHC
jgi:hypothetical protein